MCPGCAFGPKVLEKTHGRYQESIRTVNEEQLLRNIVHLRYNEIPFELNVSSIATQYELADSAEARPFFISPNPSNSNIIFRTFTSILLLLGLGAMKKGLASAEPASSYWVAIDETLSSKGISLYRRWTMFLRSCSSLTVRIDS